MYVGKMLTEGDSVISFHKEKSKDMQQQMPAPGSNRRRFSLLGIMPLSTYRDVIRTLQSSTLVSYLLLAGQLYLRHPIVEYSPSKTDFFSFSFGTELYAEVKNARLCPALDLRNGMKMQQYHDHGCKSPNHIAIDYCLPASP